MFITNNNKIGFFTEILIQDKFDTRQDVVHNENTVKECEQHSPIMIFGFKVCKLLKPFPFLTLFCFKIVTFVKPEIS